MEEGAAPPPVASPEGDHCMHPTSAAATMSSKSGTDGEDHLSGCDTHQGGSVGQGDSGGGGGCDGAGGDSGAGSCGGGGSGAASNTQDSVEDMLAFLDEAKLDLER